MKLSVIRRNRKVQKDMIGSVPSAIPHALSLEIETMYLITSVAEIGEGRRRIAGVPGGRREIESSAPSLLGERVADRILLTT